MKNAKHTPGLWEVDQIDQSTIQIKAAGVIVAEVCSGSTFTRLSDEQQANARLIVAAPELLSALQQAIAWMDGERTAIDALANARAIIAKATTASAGVNRKTMADEFTIGVVMTKENHG